MSEDHTVEFQDAGRDPDPVVRRINRFGRESLFTRSYRAETLMAAKILERGKKACLLG